MNDEVVDNAIAEFNSQDKASQDVKVEEPATENETQDTVEVEKTDNGDVEQTEEKEVETKEPTKAEKKIARQKAANAALNKQLLDAKQRLAEYEAKQAEPKEQVKQSALEIPELDNFDTTEEYQEAMRSYASELAKSESQKLIEEQEQELMHQKVKAEMAAKQTKFISDEEKFRVENSDYDDVAEVVDSVLGSYGESNQAVNAFKTAILEFDNVPSIVYNLGQNAELLEKISTLNPIQAVIEITRLADGVKSSVGNVTAQKSKAAPPTPLRRGVKGKSEMTGRDILDSLGL